MNFKNMKVSTKLLIGFSSLLVLMIIISAVAIYGTFSSSNYFTRYRAIARDNVLIGRVQANILEGRLAVLKFINSGGKNKQALTDFHERFKNVKELGKQATKDIQDESRAPKVKDINGNIDKYDKGFEKVGKYLEERNNLVYNILDPNGLSMRKIITEIMESAYADGDANAAFYAGRLQEHVIIGRLYAAKFLDTNDKDAVERSKKEIGEEIDFLINKINLKNQKRKELFEDFLKKREIYRSTFNKLVTIVNGRNEIMDGTLNKIGPLIASDAEWVKLDILKEQNSIGPEVEKNNSFVLLTILIIAIIALTVGIILGILITRQITKPLGGEPQDMADIAEKISNGDLSIKLKDLTKLDGLNKSITNMAYNLRKMISQIKDIATNLAASSEEINATATTLTEAAQNQAASAEETSASIEELTASIKQINEQANSMKEASDTTLKEAQEYKTNMESVAEEMNSVTGSTEKIGDIIKVINDIADQTNLLSLNAAIEAARAGEHGKGFTVVAEEISKLATRSSESTKEIEKLIKESIFRIKNGVESVQKSSESFDTIVTTIQENNNAVALIAQSVEEQRAGTDQIQNATEEVNNSAQSASASTEELSSSTTELHNQAEQLNQIVGNFVLNGHEEKYIENRLTITEEY